MRVLGIDPGLRLTGYGCVDLAPGAVEPTLIEAGVLRLDPATAVADRLVRLHEDLDEVIGQLAPERMVVEQLFSHAKHVRTAILMGHARGVVLLAGRRHDLVLDELTPAEIKMAVTGRGRATKQQVQHAVMAQCGLAEPPEPPDVADAIAIALAAARRIAGARMRESAAPPPITQRPARSTRGTRA